MDKCSSGVNTADGEGGSRGDFGGGAVGVVELGPRLSKRGEPGAGTGRSRGGGESMLLLGDEGDIEGPG